MDHYEMVEKLREKTKVTYEEAKAALEACDWDVLDALVLLENEGKVKQEEEAHYTTQEKQTASAKTASHAHVNGAKIRRTVTNVVNRTNKNFFVVNRKDEEILRLPLTAFILLLVFLFHISLILLVVGLFCGARYSFKGDLFAKDTVNSVMDKAADKVDDFKKGVQDTEGK